MPMPLTDLERRILDYLVEYLRQNTYQPSVREIGRRFDIKSTKTVSEQLQSLADKGWIERDPSRSRGVRLLGLTLGPQTVTVPWVERRAGAPPGDRLIDAFEFDRKLAGTGGTFIVAMQGDALAGDGIRAGDLLLVEPVQSDVVEDGDIVVARVGEAQTVRRLVRRDGAIVLEPGSDSAPRLTYGLTEPEIAGRVLGIVRRLRVPIQPKPEAPVPAHGSL